MSPSLTHAFRRLRRHPIRTVSAIAIIGLGLGLTATSESILYGLYHRPLPLPQAERLLQIQETDVTSAAPSAATHRLESVPYDHYLVWVEGQRSFDDLSAWYPVGVAGRPEHGVTQRYSTSYLTPNTFRALGVNPEIGRTFVEADALAGSEPVVLISDEIWATAFGHDPKVLGEGFWVSGQRFTIVGVMPSGFRFPAAQRLWLPLTRVAQKEMEGLPLQVFGRLKAGVSAAAARAELQGMTDRLPKPTGPLRARVTVSPYAAAYVDAQAEGVHYRMFVGVVGLLLIACVDVASLLLARACTRVPEFATRLALGASRRRLFAESFTEPAILCLLGSLLAAFGTYIATEIYASHYAATRFAWELVRFDSQTVLFTLAAAGACVLLAGTAPAMLASRSRLTSSRREIVGRTGGVLTSARVLGWLLTIQVTLSVGLLIATGASVRSWIAVSNVDPGFDADRLLTGNLSLYHTRQIDPEKASLLLSAVIARAGALPGVRSVAYADSLPIRSGSLPAEPVETAAANRRELAPTRSSAVVRTVSESYFSTLGLPLLNGRTFTPGDTPTSPQVALVTRSLASALFANGNAVGQRLRLTTGFFRGDYEVVGIAADSILGDLGDSPAGPGIYLAAS
jgi:putative ABC transport system permease protein